MPPVLRQALLPVFALGWLLALAPLGPASPATAQDLSEARRIEIARQLRVTAVEVITGTSRGSGFVVDASARWVVTNAHVASGAEGGRLRVRLGDGRVLAARLVAYDPGRDLAVLEVPELDVRAMPLADSDYVQVGQTVLAYGSPYGLDGTLTQGIVSARRDMPTAGGALMRSVIQTDAPINPGNSGGPLVNARGEVIGVNTSIVSRSGASAGIGFAVPANEVRALLTRLRDDLRRPEHARGVVPPAGVPAQGPAVVAPQPSGQATPGAPSATLTPIPPPGAATPQNLLPLPGPPQGSPAPVARVYTGFRGEAYRGGQIQGVRIVAVEGGSPAATARLVGVDDPAPAVVQRLGIPWTGYVILAVDGARVTSPEEIDARLATRRPGDRVVLTITVGPGALNAETVLELGAVPERRATPRRRGSRRPR